MIPQPAFRFDAVGVDLGGRPVLANVTAEIPAQSLTVIAGPSGAGKSTLLRLCNRLTVPDRGQVLFNDTDTADLDVLRLRRRVGMVFQKPVLLAGTVRDNLHVASSDATETHCVATLGRVSLDDNFLDRPGDSLSGGEAQRVCLARTLIADPDVLLLDEPTSALDPTPRGSFERLVRGLVADGLTVLWVTHDVEQLYRLADRLIVLLDGRPHYQGPLAGLDGSDPRLTAFLEGSLDG